MSIASVTVTCCGCGGNVEIRPDLNGFVSLNVIRFLVGKKVCGKCSKKRRAR